MGQDLKRKGRTLLITGGALSLTGIAMYASAFTMISDSTDIGSYFSISGIALFASAIPFYAIGTNYCIKGKKTSFSASPGRLALMF
ncbi:MAG: hypothetical protein Q4G10_06275 [Bacteroidia bacterium]|nr:hypothetical protein [Bacteroidia bacterium]